MNDSNRTVVELYSNVGSDEPFRSLAISFQMHEIGGTIPCVGDFILDRTRGSMWEVTHRYFRTPIKKGIPVVLVVKNRSELWEESGEFIFNESQNKFYDHHFPNSEDYR